MNKFIVTLLLLIQTVGFSQTRDESQVIALCRKKFEWMKAVRLDSLDRMVDERLSYIHSNGWIQTKKEFLDDFASGKLIIHDVTISEIKARVYKRSAVVTGKGVFTTSLNGNKSSVNLLFTEVYVLERSGWKLVSRHATKLV